jgi:hypothetical protein
MTVTMFGLIFSIGPVLDCLIGRGYFEEVGRSGSRVYKNNYLSEVLRPGHPSSLKAAIGLAFVPVSSSVVY